MTLQVTSLPLLKHMSGVSFAIASYDLEGIETDTFTEAEGFGFPTRPTSRAKRESIKGKETKTNALISVDEILLV
jgi:hypothetical protein